MAKQTKVYRYQKEGGRPAAIVFNQQTGDHVAVSGEVQTALEAQAFAKSGGLDVPAESITIEPPRPRSRRGGRRSHAEKLPPDVKPDADSADPATLSATFEEQFAQQALKLGGYPVDEE